MLELMPVEVSPAVKVQYCMTLRLDTLLMGGAQTANLLIKTQEVTLLTSLVFYSS
jgi:hypothetical protein